MMTKTKLECLAEAIVAGNLEQAVETTRKALGLSERFIPMCTVLIGYPHEHPTPKDKWNPDNITWGIQNK